MNLAALLSDISGMIISHGYGANLSDVEIVNIETDSRKVKEGRLFVAISGYAADGHAYIGKALDQGAAAVLAERIPEEMKDRQDDFDKIILVKNTRKALGPVAAAFYGYPSKDMVVVGITGTNGKTTTSYLLEHIFTACGFVPAVMGTVNVRYQGKEIPSPTTTLDALSIQRHLAEMKHAGVTHVVMEVSSHGICQHRVDGCLFDVVAFTNLTQDHLDYHGDMESYFDGKKQLFTRIVQEHEFMKQAVAVINRDHEFGRRLSREIAIPEISIATDKENLSSHGPGLFSMEVTDNIEGMSGRIQFDKESFFDFQSSLTGRYNLENILCAAGIAHALGISPEHISQGIFDCNRVPGRLERVKNEIGRHVFVDYAHTPDALENVLTTLKENATGRLICVAGCGGDRDVTKRSPMGKIALAHSDIAVITSDNPRTEDPAAIIEDVIRDLPVETLLTTEQVSSDSRGFLVEQDRRKALNLAVAISQSSDIILAAGKGHETYQILGTEKIHFDDVEELALACKRYGKNNPEPICWTIADLSQALGVEPESGNIDGERQFHSISMDSRHVEANQIFLALKGERFDGHSFIEAVVEKGVSCLVAADSFVVPEKISNNPAIAVFKVENTLEALGKLAHFQRMRANVRVAAITGTSGKTTTREMVASILKTRFSVLATRGNLNNEIGLPMTLLNLSSSHEWAVVEMGMNHAGEILALSKVAKPDIAVITNTGAAHLEGLGSIENVARAKAEIFAHVNENAVAVLPVKDDQKTILVQEAQQNPNVRDIWFFGGKESGEAKFVEAVDIQPLEDGFSFAVQENGKKTSMNLHCSGQFMISNALCAVAVGKLAGIPMEDIARGIETFQAVSGRMSLMSLPNGTRLIDDTYNANPKSVKAALETLVQRAGDNESVAVLGDMLELGNYAKDAHHDVGAFVAAIGVNQLFLFGDMAREIAAGAIEGGMNPKHVFHGTREDIAGKLFESVLPEQWVLVKGSHSMGMEQVIQLLREKMERRMYMPNQNRGQYAV